MPEIEKEKEIIEKENLDADTSPAPDSVPGLNNATVPTPEQEENANITPVSASDTAEPESEHEPNPNLEKDDEPGAEPGTNPDEAKLDTTAEDATVSPDPIQVEEQEGELNPELGLAEGTATKTFTQSQVDEIAGKARKEGRDKALKDTFARYGVNSVEELDNLFGDAQRFATSQDELKERTRVWEENDKSRNAELASLKESVALMESGIDKARYEDAKLILKGKGLEVTAENIASELATHPEWNRQESLPQANTLGDLPIRKAAPTLPDADPLANEPATKIQVPEQEPQMPALGNNSADNPQPELSERERAMKLFKV